MERSNVKGRGKPLTNDQSIGHRLNLFDDERCLAWQRKTLIVRERYRAKIFHARKLRVLGFGVQRLLLVVEPDYSTSFQQNEESKHSHFGGVDSPRSSMVPSHTEGAGFPPASAWLEGNSPCGLCNLAMRRCAISDSTLRRACNRECGNNRVFCFVLAVGSAARLAITATRVGMGCGCCLHL